jgi:hypothetical protein
MHSPLLYYSNFFLALTHLQFINFSECSLSLALSIALVLAHAVALACSLALYDFINFDAGEKKKFKSRDEMSVRGKCAAEWECKERVNDMMSGDVRVEIIIIDIEMVSLHFFDGFESEFY